MTLHITCAAVRDTSGSVWSLPPPKRHHHILGLMHEQDVPSDGPDSQGFMDSMGNFQSRLEAFKIATAAGQVTRRRPGPLNYQGPELFSEDMW